MKPYIANWPITTPEAEMFWASNHKCNIMKALIAFCRDEENFHQIAKRAGYTLQWRNRAWAAFSEYVATPEMIGIPFSEMLTPWWHCMPGINKPIDPPDDCSYNEDFNEDFRICEGSQPIQGDYNEDFNEDYS